MKKKILSLLTAFAMVFGILVAPFTSASAAPAAEDAKTTKVTVHKLLAKEGKSMTEIQSALEGKYVGKSEGMSDLYQELADEIGGVYFAWQNANGEWINQQGQKVDSVDQAYGGLTVANKGFEFDTSGFPQDDSKATTYKLVEVREKSTYIGTDGKTLSDKLAVPVEIELPLYNEDGLVKEAHVYPKNTEVGKPDVTKKEDENNNQVAKTDEGKVDMGQQVPYVVETTIEAGSTYKHVAWNDRMSHGLTFDENVTVATDPELNLVKETDYTLEYKDNGFVLQLTNSGLKKLGQQTAPAGDPVYQIDGEDITGKNTAVKFTLKYTATVNEDAIVDNALENTVTFHYGNKPGFKPLPGDRNPEPQTGKTEIEVNKSFVSGDDMTTSETWPADLSITLKLEEYNPETNTWSEVAGKGTTLNSTKTNHKFEGLDKDTTYRVVEEEVNGWVPNYSVDNEGKLTIKNRKNDNPNPVTPEEVIVRTGGKKFVKTNQDGTVRLAGAEFIVGRTVDGKKKYIALKDTNTSAAEKSAYEAAEKKYIDAINAWNKAVEDNKAKKAEEQVADEELTVTIDGQQVKGKTAVEAKIAEFKSARDEAYDAMNLQWKLVDSENDAFKFVTNQDGQWEVKGLKYDVDDAYFYKETKSPQGYADNKDEYKFTINKDSYKNVGDIAYEKEGTKNDAKKIVNTKVTIPQTGGIGSVIFIVAGLAIMAGAFVAYKKSQATA